MSTAGSALFPMARAPNACMQDRPRKSVGGDMEILNKGSHRLQLHPKRTEVGSTQRWWVRYESICSLARHKLWQHAFLKELSQVYSSSICHRCLRHETSGWHSSVASFAGSPDLWREHWSRQDHLLDPALPSFPKEAPESAICEASVYWTLGRGR